MRSEELQQTDLPVGEILRRTRLHYGQSLSDIERVLRIRAVQIDAIESGRYENLPGRVYTIGFIRSYSEYLGLDGNKMIHLFKTQAGGKTVNPELHFPVAASDSKIPPVWLVGASVAAAILIVLIWWGLQSHSRSQVTEIPEVAAIDSSREQYGPAKPEGVPMTVSEKRTPVAVQPQPDKSIILNIRQNSWVEITDKDGKAIVSRVLKAGDKYFVPDRPDLSMSLGNAGGIELVVDGQTLRPLGEVGQVRRNIPLDAAHLKENFSQQKKPSAQPAE